ncbi:DUF6541 family protein [Gleimia hominis]|uniref:DUF6541 family protein n=1 Tax=Gleimia hominis TaxID=595468 RepID=UPI000C802671|nr:DUF6541 family protein [Gleimia hominis]WIK64653.1 hypothetical protein CJ187_000885 [Gleimia hominis]
MLNWFSLILPFFLALVVIYVPGVMLLSALGTRRFNMWAFAPAVSIAWVAGLAVALPLLDLQFSWPPLVIATLAAFAVLHFLRYIFLRFFATRLISRQPQSGELRAASDFQLETGSASKRPRIGPAVWGTLISFPFALGAFIAGIKDPHLPPQTWDGIFHLSAIRWILESGNGSTRNLAAVATMLQENQSVRGGLYPAAFHDIAALITPGTDVIVAANALSLITCAVIWPMAAACLAAVLAPGRRFVPVAVALAATTYSTFPELTATRGTLWPLTLSYALLPLLLAGLVQLFLAAPPRALRVRTAALCLVVTLAIGLAHPQGVLAAIVPLVFLMLFGTFKILRNWRLYHAGQYLVLGLCLLGTVGGIALIYRMRLWEWFAEWESQRIVEGNALRELVKLGLDVQSPYRIPAVALGIVLLVGMVVCVRRLQTLWLVAAWIVFAWVYIALQTDQLPGYQLAAFWYYDQARLGGILPIFGAVMAGIGLDALRHVGKPRFGARARQWGAVTTTVVFIIASLGLGVAEAQAKFAQFYQYKPGVGPNSLVSADEIQMIKRLGNKLQPGGVVIGDPRAGTTLVYALTGQPVLFRHLDGAWQYPQYYIGQYFDKFGHDAPLCERIAQHKIKYVYADSSHYWIGKQSDGQFDGLAKFKPEAFPDALKLIDKADGARVFEIKNCPVHK